MCRKVLAFGWGSFIVPVWMRLLFAFICIVCFVRGGKRILGWCFVSLLWWGSILVCVVYFVLCCLDGFQGLVVGCSL